MEGPAFFSHPTAIIDEGAAIGEGSRIWHFSHLMKGCRVGTNCIIGQNVYIDREVTIGNGVKIQNNVSVYKGVTIEADVFLGPSVVFTNVINPRSFIERKNEFLPTVVRKGASIGANTTVVCGVEIGSYALIGAGAVIVENVAPFALVVGNPGRQIGWVSRAGITLDFTADNVATCSASGEKYVLKNQFVFLISQSR